MKVSSSKIGSLKNHGPLNSNVFSITFTNLIGHCFNHQGYSFKPKVIFETVLPFEFSELLEKFHLLTSKSSKIENP